MGRPERSVDVESGPVPRLAGELRALRLAAGSPSYRTLAGLANYSATVLSRAASGRELPSLPVLLAYVTACGGDPAEWEVRWREVARQLEPSTGMQCDAYHKGADSVGSGADGASPGTGPPDAALVSRVIRNVVGDRRMARVLMLIVVAVSGWVVAFTGFPEHVGGHPAVGTMAGTEAATTAVPTTPLATLSDGTDPAESGCAQGAVTMARATVRLQAAATIAGISRSVGTVVGQVELRYSARCHAAWSRATPAPAYNVASLGSVAVTITRRGDGTYASFGAASMTVVYTDLLLARSGCLTAAASFRFAGGGHAAARTPCWTGS